MLFHPPLYGPALTISQDTRAKTNDESIRYFDRSRISICITMIVTMMLLALLIIPIWILYKFSVSGLISEIHDTIAVIFVSTLIFSAALTTFTKAKRHEIVAASAGYVPQSQQSMQDIISLWTNRIADCRYFADIARFWWYSSVTSTTSVVDRTRDMLAWPTRINIDYRQLLHAGVLHAGVLHAYKHQ